MTTVSAPQTPAGSVTQRPGLGQSAKVRRRARVYGETSADRWRARGYRYLAIAIVVGAWQATGLFMNPLFISTPAKVATAFYDLVANGVLVSGTGASLLVLAVGIVFSGVVGIGVGTLMGRISVLDRALDPLVTFGNATPSIAILPLMEIWFGQGKLSAIIFIFVIGLWQMIVNTLSGMRVVRHGFRDVGVAFGMGRWEQTWKIYLPATQPFIFAGARISLAQCTVGMILAGEELGQAGLGGLVNTYGTYLATDKLVAVIAMTCILALCLFWALRVLQDTRFRWIRATSAGRRGAR